MMSPGKFIILLLQCIYIIIGIIILTAERKVKAHQDRVLDNTKSMYLFVPTETALFPTSPILVHTY